VLIANIAAGLAYDAFPGQATVLNPQMQLPGRMRVGNKGGLGAGSYAIGAKSALATPKVNFRMADCTAKNYALRTSFDALAAGSTSIDKYGLVDCSGRTHWRCGRYGQTPEQIAFADVDCVGHL
jgi:hypothetical protein